MAVFYVNKSGDDANGGTSPLDAWLTIQHAVDSVANGDTIKVQSGVYEENVDLSQGILIYLQTDGYVVMDGSAIGGNAFSTVYGNYVNTDLSGFIINNGYVRAIRSDLNSILKADNLFQPALQIYYRGPYADDLTLDNIICNDLFIKGQHQKVILNHVTFTGIGNNIDYGYDHDWTVRISSCHFTGDLNFPSNATIDWLDYCNIRGSITYKGTTYPTLSDFQDAYPNLAPHSFNEAPDFNDDYTLRWSSPLVGRGLNGTDVGARGPGDYHDVNDELFEGAILTGVSVDDDGYYSLDVGINEGTIESAVLDFGKDIVVHEIRWDADEAYPSEVVDMDNTDAAPNRRNYEYRSHTDAEGSFAQGDATPLWQTAERGDDLSLTCRYLQLRFTLRSDGVAA